MRKYKRQIFSSALIGLIICAIAIASISLSRFSERHAAASLVSKEALIRQGNAEGKLRKGAKEKGHYVLTYDDPQWKRTFKIRTLAKISPIIVLGKVARNTCRLSQDGGLITVDYEVIVSDVLKSSLPSGTHLMVRLPGGMVKFADGTSAEFRVPAYRKMTNGKTYLLFLAPENRTDSILIPNGGPQAIFEISPDGTSAMRFSADFTAPPPPFQNLAAVLGEIRDAVKK